MIQFKDFTYQRPDLDKFKQDANLILTQIKATNEVDEAISLVRKVFQMQDNFQTQMTLVSIRNSIDTTDTFYEEEQNFFDENVPYLEEIQQQFLLSLLTSPHRKALEKEFGSLLFKRGELALKTFKPEIIEDLQKENKLMTQYSKLIASAKIEFQGKIYNLSQMAPFTQHIDRDTRHQAQLMVSKFFETNEKEFDDLYDELVQLRSNIAKKLGYVNFVQLGYDRLGRTDYNAKDVEGYRKQILETIVPLVEQLTKRKAARLQIEDLKSYDLALSFLSGNPTPKGDREWQVERAIQMYHEMSPFTKEFIDFMTSQGLLDLDSKPGKTSGGYCTYLPDFKTPFIFANFNGTQHDVEVLTHEIGHAFQVYSSRDLIPEYRWPTLEAAEIHSMSMEFLAWPWMKNFFLEDTDKFLFNHLAGSISFLPYGALIDHYQHEVYMNPEWTPSMRKACFRDLEKKYLPFKDYDDDAFLEKGTFWFRQGHIFHAPFYYIDYTLAQVCAFQYWIKHQENPQAALESYLNLCKQGGSRSFVELLDFASLQNPFKDGTIEKIVKPIQAYLDQINDLAL